jgi:hypothetical protein
VGCRLVYRKLWGVLASVILGCKAAMRRMNAEDYRKLSATIRHFLFCNIIKTGICQRSAIKTVAAVG